MARTRMSRHELKTQDEITTKIQNFTESALERKNEILIAAGAILVLVLAVIGWNYYSASRNSAAQAQLGLAIAAFTDTALPEQERYQKAQTEAQKTIDTYGSTQAGMIARYYLALSQEGLGDTAAATSNLQQVIENGDDTTKAVAQFTLAGIHRTKGENQQAIDLLKQVDASGGYSKSAVNYELGTVHEASSQPEVARDYYTKVIMEHSDSPFRSDAEAALRRLGFPVPSPAATVTATP